MHQLWRVSYSAQKYKSKNTSLLFPLVKVSVYVHLLWYVCDTCCDTVQETNSPLLQESLPELRHSIVKNELTIEGLNLKNISVASGPTASNLVQLSGSTAIIRVSTRCHVMSDHVTQWRVHCVTYPLVMVLVLVPILIVPVLSVLVLLVLVLSVSVLSVLVLSVLVLSVLILSVLVLSVLVLLCTW